MGGVAKNDKLASQESLSLHAGWGGMMESRPTQLVEFGNPIPPYLSGPGGCL